MTEDVKDQVELDDAEGATVDAQEGPTPEELAAQEEARKYGWRPKEEFNLAPEGWVDAQRFLELPSTLTKMTKDELRREREERERDRAEFKANMERLNRSNKAALELALNQARAQHRAELEAVTREQRQAAEVGDMDRYDALEARKQAIKPPEVPQFDTQDTADAQRAADKAIVDDYIAKNDWAKDPAIWEFAVRGTASQENQNKSVAELLAIAEQKAREYFPHKFEAAKPKISRVDGGGLAGGSNGKGAANLPPEAVQAGKEFIEMGVFKDMNAYAKHYFEQG